MKLKCSFIRCGYTCKFSVSIILLATAVGVSSKISTFRSKRPLTKAAISALPIVVIFFSNLSAINE